MATASHLLPPNKKDFSAADLQKYTELEAMVPAEKLLVELESIHEAVTRKRQKENAHGSRRRWPYQLSFSGIAFSDRASLLRLSP